MAARQFKSQEDCRRAIAFIFRETEAARMPVDRARVLVYAALSISGILSEHDLEARVKTLEAAVPLDLRRSA